MACKLFKSSTYSSQMLQNLYDLWQAECFCDVEIVCDGEVFKVGLGLLILSMPLIGYCL